MVGVLLTTNEMEASEWLTWDRAAKYLAVITIIIILLTVASVSLAILSKKYITTSNRRLMKKLSSEVLLSVILGAILIWYNDPRLLKGVYLSYEKFYSDLDSLQARISSNKKQHASQNFYSRKLGTGETYVVVIGEGIQHGSTWVSMAIRDKLLLNCKKRLIY